jgi:hypothetical protein
MGCKLVNYSSRIPTEIHSGKSLLVEEIIVLKRRTSEISD